jgi:hypothetical protein
VPELSATVLVIASILPAVLFVAMILAGVLGAMSLISGNKAYDEIGRGGLSMDGTEPGAGGRQPSGPPATVAGEREREIEQMLLARSARSVRMGGPALDVEAEMRRLTQADTGAHEQ